MPEQDPSNIRRYIIIEQDISPEQALREVEQARHMSGAAPAIARVAFSNQPLELFRILDGETIAFPEPWVTLDELHRHYFSIYLPTRLKPEKPGSWPTNLFQELASLLPQDKVLRDKEGRAIKLDRQVVREFILSERQQPTAKRITGDKRRALLFSYGETLDKEFEITQAEA